MVETKRTKCLEPMIENFARENLSCIAQRIEENPNVSNPLRRLYECKDCNKRYDTFQALGGHRASHKKVKLNDGDESPSTSPHKLHECKICGDEFATGQALGGHMRRHQGSKPENNSIMELDHRPRRLKSDDEVEELAAMYLRQNADELRQQRMEGDKSIHSHGPHQNAITLLHQLQDKSNNEVAEADNGVRTVDKADDFLKQTAGDGESQSSARRGEEFMCCDLNLAPHEDDSYDEEFRLPIYHEFLKPHDHPYT